MTVLSELSKVAYIGNSSQVLYPIPFEYINVDNIYVSIYTNNNEFVETWTYSNQYIIENSNVKVLSGFEIDNTKTLLIIRVIDAVQDNRYREGGDFPAKSTETSFDKLTMLIQQHQEVLDRCVKVEVLDNQTPEELLAEVYSKLDSATDVTNDAIAAAEQATIAAENATTAVEVANETLINTQEYVASAKEEIAATVSVAKQDINNTVDEATMQISDTVEQAVEDVKQEAEEAAIIAVSNAVNDARVWATGTDEEVNVLEAGEHSSRTYANFSMALANTPEDVPVLDSELLATDIIEFNGGDVNGVINVINDSNHPIKVTGMAGASATGYQIVDSLGAGDSDFEHYATGDRYGTRITNHNNISNTTAYIDLYQSNVGKSVLDATDVDTVLVPTPTVDDNSNKAATTAWVMNILASKGLI